MQDDGPCDGGGLRGRHWVRGLRSAFHDCRHLCPRTKDRMEIRRHGLKLQYWPAVRLSDESGQVLDLDWEWIKSIPGKNIGELRVDDVIGGHDNLRIIFFVPGIKRRTDPMPAIWLLAVMQKKRQNFTAANIQTFNLRRQLILARFYNEKGR